MKLTRKIVRSIAFIADLHVGSPYSPWPEVFVTPTGNEIVASEGQVILLSYWKEFLAACNEYEVDTVISCAELIDGLNPKNYGRDRMVSDLNLQIEAAEILLKPLVDGRRFYGVAGTKYHDSIDMKADKELIEKLGGIWWGVLRNIRLRKTNIALNIAHGTGQALTYSATKGDKEMLWLLAAEARGKINFHIDLMVRGHLHHFKYIRGEDVSYLFLPSWTDWIPYRPAMGLYGRQPDIGWVILMVDDEDRIYVEEKIWPLPNISQRQYEA